MKKQEWIKNFEQLMGRTPNDQEISDALGNGLIEPEQADETLKNNWIESFQQLMGREPNEPEISEAEEKGLFQNTLVKVDEPVQEEEQWTLPFTFTFYNSIYAHSKKQRIELYNDGLVDLSDGCHLLFDQLKEIAVQRFNTQEFIEVIGTEHEIPDKVVAFREGTKDFAMDMLNIFKQGGQKVSENRETPMKTVRDKEDVDIMNYKLSFMIDKKVAHWLDDGFDINRESCWDLLFIKASSDIELEKLDGVNALLWDKESVKVKDANGRTEMTTIQDVIDTIQKVFEMSQQEVEVAQENEIRDVTNEDTVQISELKQPRKIEMKRLRELLDKRIISKEEFEELSNL